MDGRIGCAREYTGDDDVVVTVVLGRIPTKCPHFGAKIGFPHFAEFSRYLDRGTKIEFAVDISSTTHTSPILPRPSSVLFVRFHLIVEDST
jgi:hypothetical protein